MLNLPGIANIFIVRCKKSEENPPYQQPYNIDLRSKQWPRKKSFRLRLTFFNEDISQRSMILNES